MSYSLKQAASITHISESILRGYIKKYPLLFASILNRTTRRIELSDRDIEMFVKIRTLSQNKDLSVHEIEQSILYNSDTITVEKVDTSLAETVQRSDFEPVIKQMNTSLEQLTVQMKEQKKMLKLCSDTIVQLRDQNDTLSRSLEELKKEPVQEPLLKIIFNRFFAWFFGT